MGRFPGAYPIVIAPYISGKTAELLRTREVGYFDLAGNPLIDAGPLYISLAGKPNPKPAQKALKSLFAPKTSRIVRILLTNPGKTWYVRDLAAEAAISIGLASRLKKRLVDLELLGETKAGVSLAKPGDLLDLWAKEYSYQKNRIFSEFAVRRGGSAARVCPITPGSVRADNVLRRSPRRTVCQIQLRSFLFFWLNTRA